MSSHGTAPGSMTNTTTMATETMTVLLMLLKLGVLHRQLQHQHQHQHRHRHHHHQHRAAPAPSHKISPQTGRFGCTSHHHRHRQTPPSQQAGVSSTTSSRRRRSVAGWASLPDRRQCLSTGERSPTRVMWTSSPRLLAHSSSCSHRALPSARASGDRDRDVSACHHPGEGVTIAELCHRYTDIAQMHSVGTIWCSPDGLMLPLPIRPLQRS